MEGSNSFGTTNSIVHDAWDVRQAAAKVLLAVSLLGVVVNLLTIFIVGLGENISKKVKIQIINMAVADLLSACCFTVYSFDRLGLFSGGLDFGSIVFDLWTFISNVAGTTFNAVISVERALFVFCPFKAVQYRRKHKLIVVAAVWCGLILCSTSQLLFLFLFESYQEIDYTISALQITSCVVIVISYTSLFIRLHCGERTQPVMSQQDNRNRDMQKVQRMLIVDGIVTVVTVMPLNVFMYADDYISLPAITFDATKFLFFINAFSTPVIYFIFGETFRKDTALLFRRLFCCRHRCVRDSTTEDVDIELR